MRTNKAVTWISRCGCTGLLAWALVAPAHAQVSSYALVVMDDLLVLDTDTQQPVFPANIPLGLWALRSVASPDGAWAFVAGWDGVVSVVDLVNGVLTKTIPVGRFSWGITITPDGSRVFVGNAGSNTISVIDVASQSLVKDIALPNGNPTNLMVSPLGTHLLVTASHKLYIINLATETFTTVPISTHPFDVAIMPDGQKAYVTTNSGDVIPIALSGDTGVAGNPIPASAGHGPLAITPDGQYLVVANYYSEDVTIIETATDTVFNPSIPLGNKPGYFGMATTPDHRWALVSRQDYAVAFFDTTSWQPWVVGTPSSGTPASVAAGPSMIVPGPAGSPLGISGDADLDLFGFRKWIPFNGGRLRLRARWNTKRHFSMLRNGTIDTNGYDAVVGADIVNGGTLIKEGKGTLTLAGVNRHGLTRVTDGGVVVTGKHHTTPITVQDGATLGGNGHAGDISSFGSIIPGVKGYGSLRAQAVTLRSRASLVIDIDSTTSSTAVDNHAAAVISSEAILSLRATKATTPGTQLRILNNARGRFANAAEGAIISTFYSQYRITYRGGDGNDVVLTALAPAPPVVKFATRP